jgi:Tfp pilus assembly protein PilW
MPVPTFLQDIDGNAYATTKIEASTFPIFATAADINTRFKSATHTDAGTITLATPEAGGFLVLTDLLISAEKVASGSCKIQFTDGSDTVVIFNAITVDAPANLAIPFSGRWAGWKDARLDTVTTGSNIDATVSVGYLLIKDPDLALTFADWDVLRG